MSTSRLRLGQLLVDAKLITAAALDEVLAVQRTDGRRLGTLLVERGIINETQLTQILSHQLSVPWVSLLHIEFSRQLLNLVPREVADRYCLVPIYVRHVRNQGETLYVAMDDPSNEDGLRACREHSGLPVRAMIAPPTDIRSAIRVYYGVGPGETAEPHVRSAPRGVSTPPPAAKPAAAPPPPPPPPPRGAPPPPPPLPERAVAAARAAAPTPIAPVVAERREDKPPPSLEGPVIEAVEIAVDERRSERLRRLLEPPPTPPPPSSPPVEEIPRPRGRAPRMVSLTLLDGTTISLPAKRPPRERHADSEPPSSRRGPPSDPAGGEEVQSGLTARDLVLALRVVANGADASEVLGSNIRWEALFSALLSLMLKKHLIADWEFVDELKKKL